MLVTADLPSWDLQLRSDPPSYALGATTNYCYYSLLLLTDRQTVLIGTRTHTPPDSISSRLRLCVSHVTTTYWDYIGSSRVWKKYYASPAESRRPVAPLV